LRAARLEQADREDELLAARAAFEQVQADRGDLEHEAAQAENGLSLAAAPGDWATAQDAAAPWRRWRESLRSNPDAPQRLANVGDDRRLFDRSLQSSAFILKRQYALGLN
jgi:hypothetical protein